MNNIEVGDVVRLKESGRIGVVAGIKDYGTHVVYFLDMGMILKFPAREDWCELVKKGGKE